ncbi:hypothetical protein FACS189440_05740 [Bacteroidia bacterium]|nr:hypothetical protein FACS189423_01640 [Bacteroidia bacterium]GHT46833.1 hypothetical protein FACS189440_05740 [Bacteroidia bacterium]
MDDYLKYTGGKELVYPGKVDSIVFHSGRERVLFTGLLISDPNIKKVGVYWNNKTDSVIIPVQRTAGIDSLEVNIPLPEGAYNFQVYSYDGEGHSSIVSNVRGNSYGATYENSLYDRPVKNAIQSPNYATINWYNGDPTCFVKVIYTDNNDKQHSVFVPASKDTTRLDYCKPMTDIVLQTYYLPDETAVDTFKVAQSWTIGADADMTETYIKNSGAGNVGIRGNFLNGNSEWGEPIDWIVTDPVKVNAHQHGWANRDGGVLHPETWGQGDFSNGKIYQVFNLPKGKYELAYNCSGSNTANNDNERARVNAYFVAAKGDLPPDIDVIESNSNTLAFFHGDAVAIRGWHTISFTLDADTEINIGFVFSLKNESQFRIKEFQLMYKAK